MGSAAHAAAVTLPRQGGHNFPQWINNGVEKKSSILKTTSYEIAEDLNGLNSKW